MAFVQHTSHLLYMEGSLKARRESATAAKMAAATSSAAAAAAAAVQGQSEGGEEDLQRGDHNAKASDNDNDEDEEEEEEDSGLTARSVFTLPSFYRTLVTVAGHYDGGCGGAGVVVGPVAAPAALLPSSSSPKTASPLAPSDTATWGGFGPSRNKSMAASVRRLLSLFFSYIFLSFVSVLRKTPSCLLRRVLFPFFWCVLKNQFSLHLRHSYDT
jgi:hypothetical protein